MADAVSGRNEGREDDAALGGRVGTKTERIDTDHPRGADHLGGRLRTDDARQHRDDVAFIRDARADLDRLPFFVQPRVVVATVRPIPDAGRLP